MDPFEDAELVFEPPNTARWAEKSPGKDTAGTSKAAARAGLRRSGPRDSVFVKEPRASKEAALQWFCESSMPLSAGVGGKRKAMPIELDEEEDEDEGDSGLDHRSSSDDDDDRAISSSLQIPDSSFLETIHYLAAQQYASRSDDRFEKHQSSSLVALGVFLEEFTAYQLAGSPPAAVASNKGTEEALKEIEGQIKKDLQRLRQTRTFFLPRPNRSQRKGTRYGDRHWRTEAKKRTYALPTFLLDSASNEGQEADGVSQTVEGEDLISEKRVNGGDAEGTERGKFVDGSQESEESAEDV